MDAAARATTGRAPRILIAISIAYLVLVLAVTLLPAPWPASEFESPGGVLNLANWFAAETWTRGSSAEFALNVLLFVPIGLIAGHFLRPWWPRVLAPIALTFAIEIIQLPLPDRVSDPRDIAANTIGALAGVLLVWIVRAFRRDRATDPDRAAVH